MQNTGQMHHALGLFARPFIINYRRTKPEKNLWRAATQFKLVLEGLTAFWLLFVLYEAWKSEVCRFFTIIQYNYSLHTQIVGFIKNATNSWFWKDVFALSFSDFLKSPHLCVLFCFGLLARLTWSQCVF